MPAICRDCECQFASGRRCPSCHSPRVIEHSEIESLSIAHMDCDAFYASIEKRDNPKIRDQPVIIGGGRRGVVATACYIARIHGVRSAMPMFRARKLCPDAIIIRPRMDVYAETSRKIRAMMLELTPAVEPLSLDEAFLNLTGTQKLHGVPPASVLIRLSNRLENELGLTGSVGLSHNKFLAKLASDFEKPRGFSIIGKAETLKVLEDKPVSLIWGVGAVMQRKMHDTGILTIGDLRKWSLTELKTLFGDSGHRLWKLARGQDGRPILPERRAKSLSNETTFDQDISDINVLDGCVWRLSVKVADRAKAKQIRARVVILKLKRQNFKLITRRRTLPTSTFLAEDIYSVARQLLARELDQSPFRLIGVGLTALLDAGEDHLFTEFVDSDRARQLATENAVDELRQRFGKDIIYKGRSLR